MCLEVIVGVMLQHIGNSFRKNFDSKTHCCSEKNVLTLVYQVQMIFSSSFSSASTTPFCVHSCDRFSSVSCPSHIFEMHFPDVFSSFLISLQRLECYCWLGK
uniref:Uncharacterized protein n=1 Tax=Coptotermes formosanus TaxID=36987 RepID=R4UJI7_COPFO|nr:hypothetical protein [Coptotermes formosanus]